MDVDDDELLLVYLPSSPLSLAPYISLFLVGKGARGQRKETTKKCHRPILHHLHHTALSSLHLSPSITVCFLPPPAPSRMTEKEKGAVATGLVGGNDKRLDGMRAEDGWKMVVGGMSMDMVVTWR